MMKRSLLFILCLFITSSCSSSRWLVTEQNSVNADREPAILNEENIILLQNEPSVEDPVMRFATYKVVEKEYEERVRVERTVQKYRPKWKFVILGAAGALFSAMVANTDLVLHPPTVGQQVAFNVTAAILAGLALSNMEPVGDPIYTGETRLQRRSGSEIIKDTTRTDALEEDLGINLSIDYKGETVFSDSNIVLSEGSFDINLATFLDYINDDIDTQSSLQINLAFNGFHSTYTIPVTDFLAPFITVTQPVALLRNEPAVDEMNVVTEVGSGSSLPLIPREYDDWYVVRFGSSDVFVSKNAGEIEWMSEVESGSPDIFEFADIPFGEIDVENSVPVIKDQNPNDRALIITNGFASSVEPRQYLGRDHELFRFYMRYAMQMDESQIHEIQVDSSGNFQSYLPTTSDMDSTGTLIVYLSGEAYIDESQKIHLAQISTEDGASTLETGLLNVFDKWNPSEMVLFADLEFKNADDLNNQNGSRNSQQSLQTFADTLMRRVPNSAVIFSHRPGQQSSLYIGRGTENKRHHIFSYYLADALRNRNTEIFDIVRYLENNVDYTARRLHDRPQDIQAFGNLTIDLAE